MQKGRAIEAWGLTKSAKDWGSQLVAAVIVLVVTSEVVRRYWRDDLAESVGVGLAATAALLVVLPAGEFVTRYVQLGRPLRELRRAISSRPLTNETAGEMELKRIIEADGIALGPLHITALRVLYAGGAIERMGFTHGITENGIEIVDATFVPVAGRFASENG